MHDLNWAEEPADLRPHTPIDGGIDSAGLRRTIEHMHTLLAEAPDLDRVRNALAIALLELDSLKAQRAAISRQALGRFRCIR
jgi:hypothetical protein